MNAMQYKITLPNDYDMQIIRNRVAENGMKTDGFEGLALKAYLIIDQKERKEYAPFYLWEHTEGMNRFIFEGFYDNILTSFGWQHINITIPLWTEISTKIKEARYVIEIEQDIKHTNNMQKPHYSLPHLECLGKAIVYNPDKWKYVEFYFVNEQLEALEYNIYEVLHISK